jgi:hypothetical protein
MPEVYIDALTINNFGPYYGEHTGLSEFLCVRRE